MNLLERLERLMALIKSTILAQISGSINGVTFSHNKGGAYARNRSLPANPGTDRQDQVRTAMASLSIAWRDTLSELQRDLWNSYGQSVTVLNRIGDSISLSGIAAFQRVNLFRMSTLDIAPILTPPPAGTLPDPPPTFDSTAISFPAPDAPILDVNLVGAPSSGYALAYYYSGVLSPGINYYRGPYLAHGTEAIAANLVSISMDALGTDTSLAGSKIAAKLTCYQASTSLPIWTINTDPTLIPDQI